MNDMQIATDITRRAMLKIGAAATSVGVGAEEPAEETTSTPKIPDSKWSRLRGFNYQPSYGANGFVLWQKLDAAAIETELIRGKRYFPKMSSLRWWQSPDSFECDEKRYAANFQKTLQIADKFGLTVKASISVLYVGLLWILSMGLLSTNLFSDEVSESRWTVEKAKAWYAEQPWLVGCNFIPSTAINQLEMWQADTFDMKTIERELGWARNLGFNTIRVYLHDLAYEQSPELFLNRMDQFLKACTKKGIRPVFVFFDDCWSQEMKIGKQPEPWPGVHNSGWLQSPGLPQLKKYPDDCELRKRLKTYVQAVLKRFGQDDRVLLWDMYNEASGWWYKRGKAPREYVRGRTGDLCLPLLRDAFAWAREINPRQPITCCEYSNPGVMEMALKWSDIITFHDYSHAESLEKHIQNLQKQIGDRPMICTEYMARSEGSRFETCLPIFAKYGIGAICWGCVAGKTNTIYGWDSWGKPGKIPEPKLWFHDIYRADGSPYRQSEVDFIRMITKSYGSGRLLSDCKKL